MPTAPVHPEAVPNDGTAADGQPAKVVHKFDGADPQPAQRHRSPTKTDPKKLSDNEGIDPCGHGETCTLMQEVEADPAPRNQMEGHRKMLADNMHRSSPDVRGHPPKPEPNDSTSSCARGQAHYVQVRSTWRTASGTEYA